METARKLMSVAHTLHKIGAKMEAAKFAALALEAPDFDEFFVLAEDRKNKLDLLYEKEKQIEEERAKALVKDRTLEQMLENGDAPVGIGIQDNTPALNFKPPVMAELEKVVSELRANKFDDLAAMLEASFLSE